LVDSDVFLSHRAPYLLRVTAGEETLVIDVLPLVKLPVDVKLARGHPMAILMALAAPAWFITSPKKAWRDFPAGTCV